MVLSDRTHQKCHGILRNAYITAEDFVYPIDFYVIDILQDPFCPIILGAPFCVLTKLNIDSKREAMSLQLAEEEVSVRFKELKKFPYGRRLKLKRRRLAAIYFNIP
jgi:hypothetical protein